MRNMRIQGMLEALGTLTGDHMCINLWKHSLGNPSSARKCHSHSEGRTVDQREPSCKMWGKTLRGQKQLSHTGVSQGPSPFLEGEQLIPSADREAE